MSSTSLKHYTRISAPITYLNLFWLNGDISVRHIPYPRLQLKIIKKSCAVSCAKEAVFICNITNRNHTSSLQSIDLLAK